MSVLYIGNDEVCLTNNSISKIIYSSTKREIEYNKLLKCIGKGKITIIINSFFSFSEHRAFSPALLKKDIESSIHERISKPDVVMANYNHLFAKGKGGEHKNDVVITMIKEDESEKHIRKIINKLVDTDLDLSHIYSFDQVINTIGISYSILNHSINVNVALFDNSSVIMVSNTTHFMFGRLIKKRENEELLDTTIKLLATTLKYISTTYLFLKNEIKITIMAEKTIDTSLIREFDPIFDGITISTKMLTLPKLSISTKVPNIKTELQLLKLSLANANKVNNLITTDIKQQIKIHKIIKITKMIAIISLSSLICYACYKATTSFKLSENDKKIEKQYNQLVSKYNNKEQELLSKRNDIYAIIATEVKKNINDNSHLETLKDIAQIFQKHRDIMFVEGYRFDCERCLEKTRKNQLNVDFALFNVNKSAKYAVKQLSVIENEIIELLEKSYKNVSVYLHQISNNKKIAAVKDVRDTIVIQYSN